MFARAITVLCREPEDAIGFLSLQLMPSPGGISGNVHAGALAATAHSQSKNIDIDRFLDEDVARGGSIPSPVPRNHIPEASGPPST